MKKLFALAYIKEASMLLIIDYAFRNKSKWKALWNKSPVLQPYIIGPCMSSIIAVQNLIEKSANLFRSSKHQ